VVKYILLPTYYDVRTNLLINRTAFEKLWPSHQKLLLETVSEVEAWGNRIAREEADREQERLRKLGMEFVRLPEPEASRYLQIARDSIWEQIVKDSPKYGARLREAFTKAAQLG